MHKVYTVYNFFSELKDKDITYLNYYPRKHNLSLTFDTPVFKQTATSMYIIINIFFIATFFVHLLRRVVLCSIHLFFVLVI